MADHILKSVTDDVIQTEKKAGVGLNQFWNQLDDKKFGTNLQNSTFKTTSISVRDLPINASYAFAYYAHVKEEIVAIYASRAGAVSGGTAATCTIDNDGSNPLDGTNIDIDALTTAGVAEDQLLNSANTVIPAEGQVKFTFATDGSTVVAGGAQVIIVTKPVA